MDDQSLSQEEIDNLLNGESSKDGVPLTDLELDTIGELFNISMGTAATTLSELIGKRVVITTPRITCTTLSQLQSEHPLPYVVVEIQYTEGLDGNNLLVINTRDVAVIADLMMDGDGQHPSETLDEIALSAIGEAMNQMVGSGATSISAMLNKGVNISPPSVRVLNLAEDRLVIDEGGEKDGQLIKVVFSMYIEDIVESEMMQLIPISFAKQISGHLLAEFIDDDRQEQQGDSQNHNLGDCVGTGSGVQSQHLTSTEETNGAPGSDKLSMILDVPLEMFVELGRTQRTIGEVLQLGRGAIVELGKSANEPVDIFVNGKAIAKGEIVAIGDNYGVRITEILNSVERIKNL
ncbi:MAG: flagellar motor switch phosphatase FliY [Syntrophaceticus sp.]|nr:flagellar motor switch phosphatase FliY [Syntrophaceticus sp.]